MNPRLQSRYSSSEISPESRLGPRAESFLEPEQDLERVAGRLEPVVGERGGGDPERPREGLQVLRAVRPEPELVVAHRGLGHARHLSELVLQEAASFFPSSL